MPNKEAVVLIIDANDSMATEVTVSPLSSPLSSPNTRFDCAKEVSIAIISDLIVRSKTNEATVVVLHTETTNNHFFEEGDDDDDNNDSYCKDNARIRCPFPNITEISGNGEVMGIRQPLPDLLRNIQQLKPTATNVGCGDNRRGGSQRSRCTKGDFESGLVYAADALHRRTAGKKFDRRIVLLTDAEHRVGNTDNVSSSQQRLLVALDSLRAMECRIQVVGMDFKHAADFDTPASGPSEIKDEQIGIDRNDISEGSIDDDGDSESENEIDGDGDGDGESDDILEIKRENEEYLIRLAKMTGGFVYASKEIQGILEKVFGSRVVQNPSKRKVVVEIAPGLLLEDARYYKLISKTASIPLKKKLVMVEQSYNGEIHNEVKKNAIGDEMLQDYETTITHWNAEDQNEELLWNRITYAYRFGSDLLPFSPLDEVGLTQRSPIKLTILGYVPDSSIPHYLRIDSPYILTGNESRRCCAGISALANGLQTSKQVAIATFIKGVGKDPILCGLFPSLEHKNERSIIEESSNQQPLLLIIMQLPFSGDVRYPHLDLTDIKTKNDNNNDDSRKTSYAICCDNLIDNLMLPQDALDYKCIPNHKVRSFYKTVVKRVLNKTCDVEATRIDPVSGIDSMDTPFEIRKQAQPAVTAFYDLFDLMQNDRGTGI